jgi:putative ABC transport system permease protein
MHFFSFILRNLTRRPTRSLLTVLGLAVAVATMIALLAIATNIINSVESSFERRGVDLVVTEAGKSSGLNSNFSQYFVDETKKIPGVKEVAWAVVSMIDVTRSSNSSEPIMIQGWSYDNFAYGDLDILSGRRLEPGDRQKVLLGETLANNLNKKIGDKVVFRGADEYEIVGIFKTKVVFEDGMAIVTLRDGQRLTGLKVTGFSVRVDKPKPDSEAEVEAVRQKILALRDPEDPNLRLDVKTPKEYTDTISQIRMMRAVSWLVSTIASIIGVIGLLNTMAMSVLERTQEIGILRAVGWPPRRVIRMVLGEASLLSLTSAAVGTAAAALGVYLLTFSPKVNGFVESGIPLAVIAEGVGLTLLIGLIGGLYPAFRASRLLPTEALRHD